MTMGRPLIQACLNGARPPASHPRLPVTPVQIGQAAAAAVAAGADSVHVHAKGGDGLDTLLADSVDAVVLDIRVAAPEVPISVTTGAWALPDPVARVAAVKAWSVLPDVASVNWHETGSAGVVEALLEHGIGVEAGLWTMEDVRSWAASPVRDEVRRVLIELPDGIGDPQIVCLAQDMLEAVREVSPHVPVLLHGEGESAWPALLHALRLGIETRIGLEDTLHLPDGRIAADNAELVRAARALAAPLT